MALFINAILSNLGKRGDEESVRFFASLRMTEELPNKLSFDTAPADGAAPSPNYAKLHCFLYINSCCFFMVVSEFDAPV
jgi:hypothetical protein